MSTGLVICSVCREELHQSDGVWYHCPSGQNREKCGPNARSAYPTDPEEVVGPFCGSDIPADTDDPVQLALRARLAGQDGVQGTPGSGAPGEADAPKRGGRSSGPGQGAAPGRQGMPLAVAAMLAGAGLPTEARRTVDLPTEFAKRKALLNQGFHYNRHNGNGEKWRRLRQAARQDGKRWRKAHPEERTDPVAVRVAGQAWFAAQVFPENLSDRGRSILLDCWRGDAV